MGFRLGSNSEVFPVPQVAMKPDFEKAAMIFLENVDDPPMGRTNPMPMISLPEPFFVSLVGNLLRRIQATEMAIAEIRQDSTTTRALPDQYTMTWPSGCPGHDSLPPRDDGSLSSMPRHGVGESPAQSVTGAAPGALAESLLHEMRRMAASNERIADGMQRVAGHVNLASPPLTVEQVKDLARVSAKTVYRWKSMGLLEPLADGVRPLLFDRAVVDNFLRTHGRNK